MRYNVPIRILEKWQKTFVISYDIIIIIIIIIIFL